jgi:hypothetical protein
MRAEGPTPADRRATDRDPEAAAWTVVWIDSQEAILARWHEGSPTVEHLKSDVPVHRRATGHVRHDPNVRHGGGGPGQSAADTRRLEHLARFLDQVAGRLPDSENLAILGPGTVAEHLEQLVRAADTHHRRDRTVSREPAGRQTDRQLIARLRRLVGAVPARRTVGAYRWTGPQTQSRSGDVRPPRRVVEKRPAGLPDED